MPEQEPLHTQPLPEWQPDLIKGLSATTVQLTPPRPPQVPTMTPPPAPQGGK
jgi:hypothetical protein